MNPVKAYLAPYTVWLKVAFLAALFLGGTFTGCKCQASHDSAKIVKIEKDRDSFKTKAEMSATALREVNRQAAANKQAAREQADRASRATDEAEKQKRLLAEREDAWKAEYDKLKKQPDCKAVLEQKLCPALLKY